MKFNRKTLLESKFTRTSITNDLPHSALEEGVISNVTGALVRGGNRAVNTFLRYKNRQNFDQWGRPRLNGNQGSVQPQQFSPQQAQAPIPQEPDPYASRDEKPGLLARIRGATIGGGDAPDYYQHQQFLKNNRREAERQAALLAAGEAGHKNDSRVLARGGELSTTGANSAIDIDNAEINKANSAAKRLASVARAPEHGGLSTDLEIDPLRQARDVGRAQSAVDVKTPEQLHHEKEVKLNHLDSENDRKDSAEKTAGVVARLGARTAHVTGIHNAAATATDAGSRQQIAAGKAASLRADTLGKLKDIRAKHAPQAPKVTSNGASITPPAPATPSAPSTGSPPATITPSPAPKLPAPKLPITPTSSSTPISYQRGGELGSPGSPSTIPATKDSFPIRSKIRSKTSGINRFARQPKSSVVKPAQPSMEPSKDENSLHPWTRNNLQKSPKDPIKDAMSKISTTKQDW